VKFLITHPGKALLLVLIATLLSAIFAFFHLGIDGDVARALKGTSDAFKAHQELEQNFGAPSKDEVLLIRAEDFGEDDTFAALENLVIDLQLSDGVRGVMSIFSLPDPTGESISFFARSDIVELPAAERIDRLMQASPFAAYLLSEDRTAAMLIVMPDLDQPNESVLAAIDEAIGFAEPALSAKSVSVAALQRETSAALIQDQLFVAPMATLICVVIALFLFRSWRAALICALPSVAGLGWTFGAMAVLGFPMDPLMALIPTILIVLGIADSVHVIHNILHHAQAQALREAVTQGMRETMPAVILAAVTTALAFLSLLVVGSPTVRNVAIIGPVGLALVTFAVYLILPSAVLLFYRKLSPGKMRPVRFQRVTDAAVRLLNYRRPVTLVAFATLALLLVAQSQTVTGYRLMDHIPRGSDLRATLAELDEVLPGSDQSFVILEAADPAQGLSAADRALLDRASAALYGSSGGAFLTRDTEGVEHALITRFMGKDGSAFALPVIGTLDSPSDAILAMAERTKAALQDAGIDEFTLTGYSLMSSVELPVIVHELRVAFYIAVGLITLLAAVLTGSLKVAFFSLIPNLIPILGVEAWLVISDKPLTIIGALAFTIAFGIAMDDTIHLMNRIRVSRQPGAPVDRAVIEPALRMTAAPIITTSIVLLAGFSVTMLSLLPSVALFGQLTAAAMLVALIATLFLFPSLMLWGSKGDTST
jgi:predicted RND superfamily exporter protein